jgi:hypothetical protein
MAFNVNDFKSGLRFGGARSSLFEVTIETPATVPSVPTAPVLVRAAQIPDATINTITQTYFGRQIKYAGNRTFADWTVILNDEDFQIRNAMETWSNQINLHEGNTRLPGMVSTEGATSYKQVATVKQFGKEGDLLRTYEFVGIYPTNVALMEVSWDQDAIQEFQVTFAYDYWKVSTGGGSTTNTVAG